MAIQRELKRAGLVIALALSVAPALWPQPVAAQTPAPPPIDVRQMAEEIDAWRVKEQEKLIGTPADTQENRRRIDEKALEWARDVHAKSGREEILRKVFDDTGVDMPRYTGTHPADAANGGGGVLSDIDFANVSAGDFSKLAKAPGAKVYGDTITFENLQAVVHRAPAEKFAPTGSSASETAFAGRAGSKETGVAFESGDPYLTTLDNLKKGGGLLAKDPAAFTPHDWAEWGKMVSRNLEAAGITADAPNVPNETKALLRQLQQLKNHKLPGSEIIPDHATPAKRAEAEAEFFKRTSALNREAYVATKVKAAATEAALRQQLENAPDQTARQQAKAKLIDHLAQQTASEQRVGGQVLNDLNGLPPGDKTLPPSRVNEGAAKSGRTALKEVVTKPVEPPGPTAKPVSGTVKYGGGFVLVAGAISGALEGANQARAEAKPGEWFVTTAAKGIAYGVLFTLGIPEAFRVGTDAGNDAMRQYYADLAAGKNPSLAGAKLWGAVTGVGGFGAIIGKALLIDPYVMLGERIGYNWRAYRAELDHLAAEQAQSRQAVGLARNLAGDLAAVVKAADAEIKLLRPVAARVEETRRLTNELRTKLDTLQTASDIHCRRAAAGSATVPAANAQAADPRVPAELADIAKQAHGVCRAADQAVSDFRGQRITAQGVSFRLENAVRGPQQDAERRLDAARRSVDALAGSANRDAALLQVAERTYQEAATLSQQATALATSIDTTTAVFQQEVTKLGAAAAQVADMRQGFINGVKRFQGVIAEQDAEWLGLVHDVSSLKIDAAAIAELEASARSFAALSALLENDIAKRLPPPCPALAALADRWAAIRQQHDDLKTALDDAAERVSAGRMCLDRVSALVPASPPVQPAVPSTPPARAQTPQPSDSAALKLAACYKSEQDYYQAAVDWFPKIHDKNAFAHWSPDPQHSAQEVPPKACSDAYYATRSNPGMWEKAWAVLQECGWKAEIQKRKEALEKKKTQCAQTPAKP